MDPQEQQVLAVWPQSRCTLKALCKTCNRKHLLILHDLNERAVNTSTETEPKENSVSFEDDKRHLVCRSF